MGVYCSWCLGVKDTKEQTHIQIFYIKVINNLYVNKLYINYLIFLYKLFWYIDFLIIFAEVLTKKKILCYITKLQTEQQEKH